MLPKKNKISRKIFPSKRDQHKTWNGQTLRVLNYRTPEGEKNPLISVVLSKKQYNTTVARNSFKRKVFSVFSEYILNIKDMTYKKMVVYPQLHISKISDEQIRKDVESFVREIQQ